MERSGLVKVCFALDQDDQGWPPVASEGVWVEPLSATTFRVDNTPWFVRGLASDDEIEAAPDADGVLWATRVIRRGGRLAIRVVPFRAGPLGGSLQAVLDAFAPLGVSGEGAEPAWPIVALDVPPDADLDAVARLLRNGLADGSWDVDEGSVTDAWPGL